jgi:hypothetical protein
MDNDYGKSTAHRMTLLVCGIGVMLILVWVVLIVRACVMPTAEINGPGEENGVSGILSPMECVSENPGHMAVGYTGVGVILLAVVISAVSQNRNRE